MHDMALKDADIAGAFQDDVLTTSDCRVTHVRVVRQLLEELWKSRFMIKWSKCAFAKLVLSFLGRLLTKDGVKPDPKKMKALFGNVVKHRPNQMA